MSIDPGAAGTEGEPREITWTSTDSLLYALGVGAGQLDATGFELEFTTENSQGIDQLALPTQVVAMGTHESPDFGEFDLAALLHGEQHIQIHQTIPAAGQAIERADVGDIYDKGKAALVYIDTEVTDTAGNPLWTTKSGLFISGEGGWGGDRGPSSTWRLPDRPADHITSYDTRADQALLYRLSGDRNPLHADPTFAAMAGFDRPILHGLCTFGFIGRALLHTMCDSNVDQFGSMGGRFKSPVTPGERLDVHMWDHSDQILFQSRAGDRIVFDTGVFTKR